MPNNWTNSLLAPVSLCHHWALGLILLWDTEGESMKEGGNWEWVKLVIVRWYSKSALHSLSPQSHTRAFCNLWMVRDVKASDGGGG